MASTATRDRRWDSLGQHLPQSLNPGISEECRYARRPGSRDAPGLFDHVLPAPDAHVHMWDLWGRPVDSCVIDWWVQLPTWMRRPSLDSLYVESPEGEKRSRYIIPLLLLKVAKLQLTVLVASRSSTSHFHIWLFQPTVPPWGPKVTYESSVNTTDTFAFNINQIVTIRVDGVDVSQIAKSSCRRL